MSHTLTYMRHRCPTLDPQKKDECWNRILLPVVLGCETTMSHEATMENGVEKKREWSTYQLAVLANIAKGKGHTIVKAGAGCAKTTTIEEGLARVPHGLPTLIVAFNRDIAKELQARIAKRKLAHAEASTCHSYGNRQVWRAFKSKVDQEKAMRLAKGMRETSEWSFKARAALCKLVSLAKGSLATSFEGLDGLIDAFGIDANGTLDLSIPADRQKMIEAAQRLLELCKLDTKTIDFDDMIWFPVVHNLRCWQFDYVFVDETQDLNAAQVELILRAVKKNGRIIAVGDPRQSIYGFRGADEQAMPRLQERLKATELPLSVCYRCASKIVGEAKTIVPELEAAPGAPDGIVEHTSYAAMVKGCAPGDFILSRANAPLLSLCWKLIKAGKKATIKGRDIGANLLTMIERARKAGAKDVAGLEAHVRDWAQREVERLRKKEKASDAALDAIFDRVDCFDALCSGAASIEDVEAKIRALFSDDSDENRIVLSSTHKAKGLERDRVWILRDTYRKRPGVEEENLFYVAVTRAKRHLIYVNKTEVEV